MANEDYLPKIERLDLRKPSDLWISWAAISWPFGKKAK